MNRDIFRYDKLLRSIAISYTSFFTLVSELVVLISRDQDKLCAFISSIFQKVFSWIFYQRCPLCEIPSCRKFFHRLPQAF